MGFLIRSFIAGYGVLVVANLLNFIALQLNIKTWNQFLTKDFNLSGISTFSQLSFLDIVFLFLLYPLILGSTAYIIFKLLGIK